MISLLIAGLSLGWNVYRDIVLKPKLKVRFQVSTLFHPALPEKTYLNITGVNHGPGRVTCNMIDVKTVIWRGLRRIVKHGVIPGDWSNPMSGSLPKTLEVGETTTLLLPYDESCFLSGDTTHIGGGVEPASHHAITVDGYFHARRQFYNRRWRL